MAMLFDSRATVTIALPTGEKRKMRFPSDAEVAERTRKQKAVQHTLSGGRTRTEIVNSAAVGAWLFDQINLTDAGVEELDPEDKAALINRLLKAEVETIERTGSSEFTAAIATIFGSEEDQLVRLTLKVPKQKDVNRYTRESVVGTDGARFNLLRFSIEPAGVLFDTIFVAKSGVAEGSSIPLFLKSAAVASLLIQLKESEEADPEFEVSAIG